MLWVFSHFPNARAFIVFALYSFLCRLQHKADRSEIRKLKALAMEYEKMLDEYKNQVDRE